LHEEPNKAPEATSLVAKAQMPSDPFTKRAADLPYQWEAWCRRGRQSVGHRRRAVLRCMNGRKEVRGYYSDLVLDPTLSPTHSLYPSAEHRTFPKEDGEMVVESRIVNDMKSHLSESEFWHAIEHLFVVGIAQKKISEPYQRRDSWLPVRHYEKQVKQSPQPTTMAGASFASRRRPSRSRG